MVDPGTEPAALQAMLRPYPAERMKAYPVSCVSLAISRFKRSLIVSFGIPSLR